MNQAIADPLRLTEALIACRSVTPADGGAHALLAAVLQAAGFRCEHLDAGPAEARVANLWATHGSGSPVVVLAGHTDVVPPGDPEHWTTDPFVPSHRDGRLHGRGTADMKTAVAAMTAAACEWVRAQPDHPGTVALLFTSDEEGPARYGTRHALEVLAARGQPMDACIVGEPTSVDRVGDMVKNGRRGSLSGHLVVHGVQGHVAYPHLADNPVHRLAPALAELVALRWDDGDEHFPPTTFQVSNLRAGTGALNVVPGDAVVDFNFRFSPACTPQGLQQRVQEVLERHGIRHTLHWTLGAEPFLTPAGTLRDSLVAAIEAEFGITPVMSTTGGTSDARFLARHCPQVMEFGVRNASAHQVDEWVEVATIEPLKNVYRRVLQAWLAR